MNEAQSHVMDNKMNRLLEILEEAKGIILELEGHLPKKEACLPETDPVFDMDIQSIGLNSRNLNILTNMGIKTVRDLAGYSRIRLLNQRYCGRMMLDNIERALEKIGVNLAR